MELKRAVALALEDKRGQSISGELLAQSLDVSRNAVWKAIEQLRREGREIHGVQNKGYCLTDEIETLSQPLLASLLGAQYAQRIFVYDQIDSTNICLSQLAQDEAPEGTIVIAARQTAGRGRLGRSFFSPDQTGLYFSVLLRPKLSADQAVMITVAAAVAVYEAVYELCGIQTQIKWVNDLYLNGKKVCGILTQAALDCEVGGMNYAVVGIGLNLMLPVESLPEELKPIVGGLYEQNPPPHLRERLTARIAEKLLAYYRALPDTPFMPIYREKNMIIGKRVRLSTTGLSALALDIDDQGGLIVRMEATGETRTLTFGEASVLPFTPSN